MSNELSILFITAVSLGFLHTIFGPDHYVPFIAMSKAGNWSMTKTIFITIIAGAGHVLSSIVIGMIGITFGLALHVLEDIESARGNIAGWALMCFGLIYFIWGIRYFVKNKKHTHFHFHADSIKHQHNHSHHGDHCHVHEETKTASLTPWILFTIFIFGPCEALIPILMYPAVNIGIGGLILVTCAFAITTILTMLIIVMLALKGIKFLSIEKYEKYSHAFAGALVFLCGFAVQVIGL
jgi:ABC-type nickel/cobalt efflux system permease component RcnA